MLLKLHTFGCILTYPYNNYETHLQKNYHSYGSLFNLCIYNRLISLPLMLLKTIVT